jgi:hypothetical protein
MPLSIGSIASCYVFPTPTTTRTPTPTPTVTQTPTPTPTTLPTFSIVPNNTTINEGETVTYTITTTNYNFPNIYITNSGTTTNPDLSPSPMFSRTIPLVGGTATFTISALNDTVYEGSETIIVNLRTGSTTGPIVATAPTVTVIDMTPPPPVYETTASYDRTLFNPATLTIPTTALKMDNRRHRFVLQATGMSIPGGFTGTGVSINSVDIAQRTTGGTTTVEARVPSSSTCRFYMWINPGYSGTANLKIYPQTDASFAVTSIQAHSLLFRTE